MALQNLPADFAGEIPAAKRFAHFGAHKKKFVGFEIRDIDKRVQTIQNTLDNAGIHPKNHFQICRV
jgi:hypothetical protein